VDIGLFRTQSRLTGQGLARRVQACHVERLQESARCVRKSVRMPLQTRGVYTVSKKHPPRLALQASLPYWQAPGYYFFVRCWTSFGLRLPKACSEGRPTMGVSAGASAGWVPHGTDGLAGTKGNAVSRAHSPDVVLCLVKRALGVNASMVRA
jgi:hypothetical protein